MPTAIAVGGPGHGRVFTSRKGATTLNLAPLREPVLSTWPWRRDPQLEGAYIPETYSLRRYLAAGWSVTIPLWVHDSLATPNGITAPLKLLPEILRGTRYESEHRR